MEKYDAITPCRFCKSKEYLSITNYLEDDIDAQQCGQDDYSIHCDECDNGLTPDYYGLDHAIRLWNYDNTPSKDRKNG